MVEILYGVGIINQNTRHTTFTLHAGLSGSRGLSGTLTLTNDEFEDFCKRLNAEKKWHKAREK